LPIFGPAWSDLGSAWRNLGRSADGVDRSREARAAPSEWAKPVARTQGRREMAPQGIEKVESAPGNVARSVLGRAGRAAGELSFIASPSRIACCRFSRVTA